MLSDEERKAIENLKTEYEKLIKEDNILFPLYKSEAKRLIDLIEKQSKEIEELKEEQAKRQWVHIKENGEVEPLFYVSEDKIKAKIEEKFLEAKGLYERGVQPQAQYTMKLLRDLEKSLLEKE